MIVLGRDVERSVAAMRLDVHTGLVRPGQQLHHVEVAVFTGPVEARVAGSEVSVS